MRRRWFDTVGAGSYGAAMSAGNGRTLGMVLAGPPEGAGFRHALGLAQAALERGVAVHLFCTDAAVRGVSDPRVQRLRESGVRVHACALSARRHRVEIAGWASPAGLGLASGMIANLDRVLSFP